MEALNRSTASAIQASGDSGRTALIAIRKDLNSSLELLTGRAEALAGDVNQARAALNEEREKMRTLKNKREIQAKLARFDGECKAIATQMTEIEYSEDRALNPSKYRVDINDALISNRVDLIIETGDPDIIRKAIALVKALKAIPKYYAKGQIGMGRSLTDSTGNEFFISDSELNSQLNELEAELKRLGSIEGKISANMNSSKSGGIPSKSIETLAERLGKNETYQRLKKKRESLIEKSAGVQGEIERLNVYMEEWEILIEADLQRKADQQQHAADESVRPIRKALLLGGAAGGALGISLLIADVLTTGGLVTAAGLAMAVGSRLLKKEIYVPDLSQTELENAALKLCSARIGELEENFSELSRQHAEALDHIRSEESDIRALSEGPVGEPENK